MGTAMKLPSPETDDIDARGYQTVHMQKDQVIERLRKQGFRITRQRKIIIDIILSENCCCCKEVYVLALKKDSGIGIATIYRTVDAMEKVGALKRKGSYQLCDQNNKKCQSCLVELEDSSMVQLDYSSIERMIEQGMRECGLSEGKKIKGITLQISE